MDDEFTQKILPVNVDRQLDDLLDIWAGHVRMSPLEKEDIYNQIFVNTEDFGYDWWRKSCSIILLLAIRIYLLICGTEIKMWCDRMAEKSQATQLSA